MKRINEVEIDADAQEVAHISIRTYKEEFWPSFDSLFFKYKLITKDLSKLIFKIVVFKTNNYKISLSDSSI